MVTVQTRNGHGLCGLFGRLDAVENYNEDAAATVRPKWTRARPRQKGRGNVKAISTHIELMM